MNLGENIYFYRAKKGLSQGELAAELDVSRQSVSKWENNSATPELEKLIKMSKLFEVTLDELVYGKTETKEETKEESPILQKSHIDMRTTVGLMLLLFGMIFFLLSIFWGNHLALGEAFGELLSLSIILASIALIATDNGVLLGACAVVYFLYSVICFGIMNVTSLLNYIFLTVCGVVILVWFIVWGTRANAKAKQER